MANESTHVFHGGNADTNAIVQVSAPANGSAQSSHASVYLTWVAVAVTAVAAVVWAGKKLKSSVAVFEKSAEDDLLDSVLDAVAKDSPDRAALREELAAAVAGEGVLTTGPLAAIMRIEESYEKKASGRYLRRISVLRRKTGTSAFLTKIENELGWEYIPEAIREQFIKTREPKVVRLVFNERKGTEA